MTTLVHGSDLHFGKPHDPEMAEAFLEAIREASPDLIVLSGDFTQRAKIREYREARAWLDRLPDVPVVVTPGNHDVPLYRVWERLFAPYRNYREFIADELDTVTWIPGVTAVALNSSAPRRAIVNGRLDPAQLAMAQRVFREADRADLKVLVAHHHLAPAPDYEGDRPLPRARRVLDQLEAMGVELVLGGHLHRAYIGNSLDVYPGQDRDRGIVIVQSGTTTSRRGRAREVAKNSFNIIRIGSDSLRVTHLMHFREAGGFAPLSVHQFPRNPDRWLRGDTEVEARLRSPAAERAGPGGAEAGVAG
jgi:3',5'-cyclic AMP phosphodiesterase CpdA